MISLIYPFAVFGYALLEEQRPSHGFWTVMKAYTLFILFMKFIWQLDSWLWFTSLQENYDAWNSWLLIGLWRTDSIGALLVYVLPEIGVLMAL